MEEIEDLQALLDGEEESTGPGRKLLKAINESQTHIQANEPFIPNYGERWRNNEIIASSFVESAVNQVVSKRMVKKLQMQWSKKGAHLLLQTRTKVLNDELDQTFRRWYPGFRKDNPLPIKEAA